MVKFLDLGRRGIVTCLATVNHLVDLSSVATPLPARALVLAGGTYRGDVDDMSKLLIGAFLALFGTVVVQIFVIPYVARRTRALDRWEKDAYELMTLINEDLVVHLAALEGESRVAFGGGTPEDITEEYERKFWATHSEVRDTLTKITQRVRRCSMISPRSAYWATLFNSQQRVWVEFRQVSSEIHGRYGNDLHAQLTALHQSNDELSEVLRAITEPVKPPKQPMWWRRALGRVRPKRRIKGRPPETSAPEVSAS